MKTNSVYSYIYDFVSQILENESLLNNIKRIILFGSTARGDYTKKSDIDLFLDIKDLKKSREIEEIIKKEINKFEIRAEKGWFLKGVSLPIKVIVGDIGQAKWEDLKEEILSYGKIIYGKFEQLPQKLEHKILISYDTKNLKQKEKVAFLRKLYGYTIKKDKKIYSQDGRINKIKGEKIGTGVIMINSEDFRGIKEILKDYKILYKLKDTWTKL